MSWVTRNRSSTFRRIVTRLDKLAIRWGNGLIGLRYAALTTIFNLHSLDSSHQSGMTGS